VNEQDETARLEKREAQIKLMIVLIQLCVLGWFLIPQHQRRLAGMRLAAASGRLLAGLARRSGRACMATELRTGQEEYTLPLMLSTARDRMAAVYEKLRSSY
jgi:hypothetical protein